MDREDRLAELLVTWEDAAREGPAPSPEEICREAPELLTAFRQLLQRVGVVNALLGGESGSRPGAEIDLHMPEGRYLPIGFHAAGGLGLVFTARDAEVGRTVAIKCLQGWADADEAARRRFLLEAEVTGRLEHPGIVPVYGVGSDDRGRPYYAMRFVGGPTLQDAINRYHSPESRSPREERVAFLRLLRSVVQVCQTVAYAHDRGVIHRDIKPANVLLGPYGETLLVDWGLARYASAPDAPTDDTGAFSAPDGGRTVLGVAAGTYAFMGPEQARGDWPNVGPSSDIFSLGATLYALLTGSPPYSGSDALPLAKACRYPPPRTVRPGVPTALSAICIKAMAERAEDRYRAAGDLADDLEHWMADEPVSAWREPLAVRVRRWARRHRTLVAAVIAAGTATAVLSAVATGILRERNRELTAANTRLDLTNVRLESALTEVRADNRRRL